MSGISFLLYVFSQSVSSISLVSNIFVSPIRVEHLNRFLYIFVQSLSTISIISSVFSANPCRALVQPLNGLLLCSRAHGGGSSMHDTTCKLFCHKGFALPRSDGHVTDQYECDNTGTWQPASRVPSCVREYSRSALFEIVISNIFSSIES